MSDDTSQVEAPIKRRRTRRTQTQLQPYQVPSAPPPPSPHIARLEEDILTWVSQRSEAQQKIGAITRHMQKVQSDLQAAREDLERSNSEVQYRMQLINQMRGGAGPAQQTFMPSPQPQVDPYGYPPSPMSPQYTPFMPPPSYPPTFTPSAGVGSYPANNRGLYPDLVPDPDGAQRADASSIRMEEIKARGY